MHKINYHGRYFHRFMISYTQPNFEQIKFWKRSPSHNHIMHVVTPIHVTLEHIKMHDFEIPNTNIGKCHNSV